MRTILSLRRHHYLKRVGIFLILVALVAGVVGCNGKYTLNIDSTGCGEVTSPGEGQWKYSKNVRSVTLEAVPDPCCEFINWTGDVGTIADDEDAVTTIAFIGGDAYVSTYSITANEDIVHVAASGLYTVGLKNVGTVVAVGAVGVYDYGQCDVDDWMLK